VLEGRVEGVLCGRGGVLLEGRVEIVLCWRTR
jgi:hypothetical protein